MKLAVNAGHKLQMMNLLESSELFETTDSPRIRRPDVIAFLLVALLIAIAAKINSWSGTTESKTVAVNKKAVSVSRTVGVPKIDKAVHKKVKRIVRRADQIVFEIQNVKLNEYSDAELAARARHTSAIAKHTADDSLDGLTEFNGEELVDVATSK